MAVQKLRYTPYRKTWRGATLGRNVPAMQFEPATVQSASLYFNEGPDESEYHAAIAPKAEGFVVTYAYYRHGSNLTVGSKTPDPLPLDAATKVFDKLIAAQRAKGYRTCFPQHA